MQNPAGRDVLTSEAIEAGPVEPVPLASAHQSMPPSATYLLAKAIQSQQVRRNCMVRKITIQDPEIVFEYDHCAPRPIIKAGDLAKYKDATAVVTLPCAVRAEVTFERRLQ
jgi:hypothetical protein